MTRAELHHLVDALPDASVERASPGSRRRRSSTPLVEKPAWKIVVAQSAIKALRRLGRTDRERIVAAVEAPPETVRRLR